MKILKVLFFIIFSVVILLFLAIAYDLSYYDSSYVNRPSITFSKNNLNSKKIKKLYGKFENFLYFYSFNISNRQKKFWKIENSKDRENLPEFINIPSKVLQNSPK